MTVRRVQWINPPALVPEDATVTYYLRVIRHPDNRLLVVSAFDAAAIQVSEMRRELDGAHSQALWNIAWRLDVGAFELIAAVFDQTHQVGRDRHTLTVYATR